MPVNFPYMDKAVLLDFTVHPFYISFRFNIPPAQGLPSLYILIVVK